MSDTSKESEEEKPDLDKMSDKEKLIDSEDEEESESPSKIEDDENRVGATESEGEKPGSDETSDQEKLNDTQSEESEPSPKNEDDENSATESFDEKPSSDDSTPQENVETSSEAASGDSSRNYDESGEEEESSSKKSQSSGEWSDDSMQEHKDEHEEFRRNQELLLKNIIDREKELAQLPQLRPCNSCEFLVDPKASENSSCCWGRIPNPWGGKRIREFWIVCAPADQTPQETFDKLHEATAVNKLSINYKLHIPDFRIGTVDELIYVSGSLSKLDVDAGRIVENLVAFMKTVVVGDLRKFLEDNDLDVINYITKFTWNSVKYPDTRPLPVLKDVIRSQLRNMEENLKARSDEYGSLDKTLQNIEKQKTGSLYTRSLADIVKKEDFVLGSRMLTTLIVVVPYQREKEWQECYTKLADMVVPDSISMLFSDSEHALYSVVVCRKFAEEFKTNAREKRFMVRDFEYSEEEMEEQKEIQKNVESLRKEEIEVLKRWLKVNFSETFAAWVHVKVMRCFVESVLRFGMEQGFQAMVLIPLKKKSLKTKLDDLYDSVDNDLIVGQIKDVPGGLQTLGGQLENTKYVYLTIPIHFISKKGK